MPLIDAFFLALEGSCPVLRCCVLSVGRYSLGLPLGKAAPPYPSASRNVVYRRRFERPRIR